LTMMAPFFNYQTTGTSIFWHFSLMMIMYSAKFRFQNRKPTVVS
jgi:hypothetical protein